jgi:hypothetical protein
MTKSQPSYIKEHGFVWVVVLWPIVLAHGIGHCKVIKVKSMER